MNKTLAAALLATTALFGAAHAQAESLVALTAENTLVRIDGDTRRASAPVRVTGAEGRLVGIDVRPANGMLYGLTDAGQIVTLDAATGRATEVSRLAERFDAGGGTIVDFNPVADRLRVMGANGQSLRINVENGQATKDGNLKYGGDLAATMPRVTAGAYTNSMTGATATMLLTLDTMIGQLNVQNPPNDGMQAPRARLSMPVPPLTAFDIQTMGPDMNRGVLIAGGALHHLDLMSGAITTMGAIAGLPAAEVLDVAVLR